MKVGAGASFQPPTCKPNRVRLRGGLLPRRHCCCRGFFGRASSIEQRRSPRRDQLLRVALRRSVRCPTRPRRCRSAGRCGCRHRLAAVMTSRRCGWWRGHAGLLHARSSPGSDELIRGAIGLSQSNPTLLHLLPELRFARRLGRVRLAGRMHRHVQAFHHFIVALCRHRRLHRTPRRPCLRPGGRSGRRWPPFQAARARGGCSRLRSAGRLRLRRASPPSRLEPDGISRSASTEPGTRSGVYESPLKREVCCSCLLAFYSRRVRSPAPELRGQNTGGLPIDPDAPTGARSGQHQYAC